VSVLDQLPAGSRVLLVRLRSLGDCVLTTPAIELLGRFRPDLRLAVVAEDRFRAVYQGNPFVSACFGPSYREVFRFHPRLTINLHGGTRSALLTVASGAQYRAGFAHFRPRWIYNIRIPRAQEILGLERKVHTAEHVASAMFYLGVPQTDIPRASLYAPSSPPRAPYAVLHALASAPGKMWPADRFAALAAWLRDTGMEPVFIGAASDDLSPYAGFRCVQGASLEEVKMLLAGASLFVGNDSGPAHMAAAFGVPAVVLFGASDPVIWGPWKTPAETMVGRGAMDSISLEAVCEAVQRLRVRV
jgi:ADP-heptose:LPS heptosyltransferase